MPRLLSVTLGAAVAAAVVLSARQAATPEKPVPAPVMSGARQLFVSGHSLTAPLPPRLAAIAEANGRALAVGSHALDGSSIRQRETEPALAKPPGGTDVVLVTEQHRVLDALSLEGTVDALRRFDEDFRRANPAGETFFFVPWADVSDFDAPASWIRYERTVAPVWACAVRRAGDGEATGRRRIHLVPASLGLAALVEALASAPDRLPGFAGASPRQAAEALFSDAVHPTPLASDFLATLTFATIFGDPPADPPVPTGLDPVRAEGLRAFARRFAADWRASGGGAAPCADTVSFRIVLAYAGYMAEAYGEGQAGFARRHFDRLRHVARLLRQLSF